MVEVDCSSCPEKCCTYRGWKIFFIEEERAKVAELYGEDTAAKIDIFKSRKGGSSIYAVTLPCPFFDSESGNCGIYEARPLICKIFPMELEPITGSVYMDQRVCPKRTEAKVQVVLVQIAVDEWCEKFWNASPKKQPDDAGPIRDHCPQSTDASYSSS